ncbi:ABC transporter related protein [Pseudomonas syringae pv. primulae]|uniref:ABC transporter related protein n=2 Tax=Pseudomonas syringae group genomosp. 3 TaxID=251701 RepID=A0A3M3XEX2_9PSED|nr:ABC transporter related protein [Pseudomonas syringae pv. primulae]
MGGRHCEARLRDNSFRPSAYTSLRHRPPRTRHACAASSRSAPIVRACSSQCHHGRSARNTAGYTCRLERRYYRQMSGSVGRNVSRPAWLTVGTAHRRDHSRVFSGFIWRRRTGVMDRILPNDPRPFPYRSGFTCRCRKPLAGFRAALRDTPTLIARVVINAHDHLRVWCCLGHHGYRGTGFCKRGGAPSDRRTRSHDYRASPLFFRGTLHHRTAHIGDLLHCAFTHADWRWTQAMKPLLKTRALEIRTAHEQLVEPLSIELRAGQVLTIIGETGSGKSLFAQGIIGNLPQGLLARGHVEFANGFSEEGQSTGRRALWGRDISVLPQEPWLSLDPTMRALAQVEETHRHVGGKPKRAAREHASEDMARLGLQQAHSKFPFELSGGMAQRVAFAATHAGGAKLMIADEPTKGLDRARIGEIIALLKAGLMNGGALLIITHDIEVARQLGGEVMIMLKGRVIESGRAEKVLSQPTHEYTKMLIEADPSRWNPRHRVQQLRESVVQVRDLSVSRGGRVLFEQLSFELKSGEIVGVTGASGCGKSTLGDIILGLTATFDGTVTRTSKAPRVSFQKLYQDPVAAFPPSITLKRHLEDVVRLHGLNHSHIDTLMRRLRLESQLLTRLPGNVSGGELQRISLLRVLLLKPVFIFADEPSSRLDLISQKEMIDILVEVARENETAILLVSHDEALINAVSDKRVQLSV